MDYDAAVAYLDAHIGRGMKPGLERISALLEMMGNPEAGYPIVHIAGTNGKTSTTRILAAILSAHDLTVGYFISPHLERVEERIGLGTRSATPSEFAQAVTDVAAFADIFEASGEDKLTYFELTAAMAFAWFAEIAANVGVVEVGLGGRLDATNVAHGDVSVITSIGLDHTEFLGSTLEEIAVEKLGILKPGTKLVTGRLPEAAGQVAARIARERQAQHFIAGRDFHLEGVSPAVEGWMCQIGGIEAEYDDVFLPLLGRHQVENLVVAIAAAEALLGKPLNPESVKLGVASARSPGRLEPMASAPLVVLDGAHNADGFEALGRALGEAFETKRWVLVLAAMKDKDVKAMLKHLEGRIASAVTTTSGSERSMTPEDLRTEVEQALTVDAQARSDPAEALELARELAGRDGAVIVAGSLYLVGHIRSLLTGGGAVQRNER